MKVKVINKGFYGGNIYRPGDDLVIKDKSELGSWMKEVKPKAEAKPKEVKPKAEKGSPCSDKE